MALAGAAALAVILLLAAGTGLIWLTSRGASELAAVNSDVPHTPTPRAISFTRSAAPPVEGSAADDAQAQVEESGPAVESTPTLLNTTIEQSIGSEDGPVFEAATEADLMSLASGSWSGTEPGLVNDGERAVSERWLRLAAAPGPNFAVEAEIRVTKVLETVCDQSFGIAGGSPGEGLVLGGGVFFPCSGGSSQARLTEVTSWEDGYNADPVIADASYDPADDWHLYRMEVRDGELTMLVDGEGVVSGEASTAIDGSATDIETGLWSQGVGLEVRRVAVYALAD